MKTYVCIYLFVLLPFLSVSQTKKVMISELLYDSPLSESGGIYNGEFISIYNYGTVAEDVSGWRVVSEGFNQTFVFPAGSILPSRAKFYVAYCNKNGTFTLGDIYAGFALGFNDQVFYQYVVKHANTGEYVKLCRLDGSTQDSLYYEGTEERTKVPRLEALNADNVSGRMCLSIQRQNMTIEEEEIVFNPLDYTVGLAALDQYPTSALTENGTEVNYGYTSFMYDASGNRTARTVVLPEAGPMMASAKRNKPEKDTVSTSNLIADSLMSGDDSEMAYSEDLQEEESLKSEDIPKTVYTDQLQESDVLIYPNPTQGALAVEIRNMNPQKPYHLEVFSMNGMTVFRQSRVSSYTTIDLSGKPKGIYMLRIWSEDKFITWKIIKE